MNSVRSERPESTERCWPSRRKAKCHCRLRHSREQTICVTHLKCAASTLLSGQDTNVSSDGPFTCGQTSAVPRHVRWQQASTVDDR